MSFDLQTLRDAARQRGRVVRVVVAEVHGSAPREVGAAMLVWPGGQTGTIGGGALELEACRRALAALDSGDWLERFALGPGLGQCCGGAVTLLAEVYDRARLEGLQGNVVVRRVSGRAEMPLEMRDRIKRARNAAQPLGPQLKNGWMLEPVSAPTRQLWVSGAGHVGRAVIGVLAPLAQFQITWIDTAADRFPAEIPANITRLIAQNPADLVQYAPTSAEHLIFTYSHALDLEICHQLLRRGFASAGLIGSASKWARFRTRLAGLGHSPDQISRITCPIGQPQLGKQPQAIAVGVAADLLSRAAAVEFSHQRAG
jgi:xanthine dehydrogenase accessory factor